MSNRIHELLRQGEYAPQAVLDAARQNALQEHAQTLAYMERDLADGVAEAVFQDTEIFRGGFPELTDRLAGLLDDTDFLTDLNDRLSALGEAYAEDKDLMRMHFYKPDKVAYEDFSPEQMDVIYSVAESGGELEELLNPDFPPEQMQLIADVQNRTDAMWSKIYRPRL